ncbi:glycerol kinase GlpK [Kibdelosporangium phytohabitans]|uniref:Glycerol kinase n=1 Tax=Kibdelosporangium phytohabitans TaxID=860235 RepID=A0A0N9I2P5_9PSEU|nr:glycerol kinase GlpK [Kibdelosporangium phytohabitans]ALG10304.1 glycerol kinase [Kibdelosporangium phytohabitans]MBE1461338.1 glycerol kinase [Kibdelosporangium phytohabitans]
MTHRYVMSVDQGTTSTRCILFDARGRLVSVVQREHQQHFPRPGWVEHDAAEIWRNLARLMPEALARAGASAEQIVGLGIANQRETTVLWDRRTGAPIGRAIVWQDTRTDRVVEQLTREPGAKRVRELCGLPLATYFSAPKIRWLLDQTPGLPERAECGEVLFGTTESWLIWNLTGGLHITDVTNASRTMLMNLRTLSWDDELLDFFGIPRAMLPEIRSSTEVYGTTTTVVPGIRIAAALGDQQAALFGQTCFAPGEAKCTYGTGSFLLLNTGQTPVRSAHGMLTTVGFKIGAEPAVYALEGSIAVTGSLVQWLRDSLELIGTAPEIETLARTVADNGGCYIVPAFSGLFAPHWHSEARGVIAGLTSYITKGHLARAVLEATGWQTREVVDAMNADSGLALSTLRVDGGMTANNLLMQIVADVLDVPVVRPMVAETVSLGAAYAAGLSVGYWPDLEGLRRNWHRAGQWQPTMAQARREAEYVNWRQAVELTFGWMRPVDAARPPGTDVVDVILDDHRRMENLLRELRDDDADRAGVLRELASQLSAHVAATERVLHTDPAEGLVPEDPDELERVVQAHIRDEERTLLNELRRTLSPSDRTALGRAFTAERTRRFAP